MIALQASRLNRLSLAGEEKRLRQAFHDLSVRSAMIASQILNHDSLRFPTLFLLIPEIDSLNLYQQLSLRNLTAILLCAQKAGDSSLSQRLAGMLPKEGQCARLSLRGMLLTGYQWDISPARYDLFDAVLDCAAASLLLTYRAASVLPAVCHLIFRRNRQNQLIHDLAWCFFECCDTSALKLTANYILSNNPADVALACRLLHLSQPQNVRSGVECQALYRNYLSWLQENEPYVYFTGEQFQQCSDPEPFRVDPEARYLCKRISPRSASPLLPLTEEEQALLAQFRTLAPENREQLSSASARLHNSNVARWQEWMKKQSAEQLDLLRREGGYE
jgi:hypothetical protein